MSELAENRDNRAVCHTCGKIARSDLRNSASAELEVCRSPSARVLTHARVCSALNLKLKTLRTILKVRIWNRGLPLVSACSDFWR